MLFFNSTMLNIVEYFPYVYNFNAWFSFMVYVLLVEYQDIISPVLLYSLHLVSDKLLIFDFN